ncbi:MAG: hypothetical protein H7234_00380 [Herminiimonas sp.]|nr:hypothetical protein [Herminiimonas sp.]
MMPTVEETQPTQPWDAASHAALAQEWCALQHDHEQYEKNALLLKIVAIVLCFIALAVVVDLLLVGLLIAAIWLQEAIVRTSQARLGLRLLQIEESLRCGVPVLHRAFQLHSDWLARRGGSLRLLREYGLNAVRPTVAFPYVALLAVLLAALPATGS